MSKHDWGDPGGHMQLQMDLVLSPLLARHVHLEDPTAGVMQASKE